VIKLISCWIFMVLIEFKRFRRLGIWFEVFFGLVHWLGVNGGELLLVLKEIGLKQMWVLVYILEMMTLGLRICGIIMGLDFFGFLKMKDKLLHIGLEING
jgi:hypothetical protein